MLQRILLASLFLASITTHAAEGMWTLDNLPLARMREAYGFTPDQAWVDKVMRASVRLAGGCSGSFVSRDGLLMTNHHCIVDCIQDASSASRDLVRDGFLAGRRENELRCPEVELNRLEQITDVTAQVKAATQGLEGQAFKQAQNAVRAKLTSACVGTEKATVRCDLVNLYQGGQYQVYRYHRYSDARLVWAPEAAIADFGGDPDNFNFPRYALDAALLRAYENDQPVATPDHLKFSRAGAAAAELTLVTGHPGSTRRLLTVAQLETERDLRLLQGMLSLAELRGVLRQYGRQGTEAARVAQGALDNVENGFKVNQGEFAALQDPELMRKKRLDEAALKAFVAADPSLRAGTAQAWAAIEQAQERFRNLEREFGAIEANRGFLSQHFGIARTLVRAADERAKPDAERLPGFVDARLPEVEQGLFSPAPIYPEFEKLKFGWALTKVRERLGPDHAFVQQLLGRESPAQFAERLIQTTTLGDMAVRRALWVGGRQAVAQSNDPFIRLALAIDPAGRALRKQMEAEVDSVELKNTELIAQARFTQLGTGLYPDATFTLRLSYGEVKGWLDQGRAVAPFTNVGGAFRRHTGAAPFALPPAWLAAKDKLDPAQPMNFVTDNDIVGGNSGSPVINRNAEIVGLAFDGNIESIGGAYGFDERNNRMVAVHSGFMLDALRKVYGADALVEEITRR
ncbi:MAG: S46 family peptidase [Burkholderiaceae bacterium]